MSIEQIAEEKYPFKNGHHIADGIENNNQKIRREAFIAGSKYGKEWISVETELPKSIERVLLLCKSGHIEVGYYDSEWQGDSSFTSMRERGYTITHWMPLPEPPNKETYINSIGEDKIN